MLKYWDENDIFKKHLQENPAGLNGENEFVFYDGPPFANGLPHYGHLLTGYVKDIIPRFQTMQGKRVDRRFGWDTHGLPAELEAQKELGIEDVTEIKALGIDKFNDACRKSVLKYTAEWEEYVHRQARWVDFANDYKTLDPDYMESVIWAFKQLYQKELAYKGYKVLPYCWNDQTPLSNHELRMDDDVYKERQDNTVTVAMKIDISGISNTLGEQFTNAYLAVWTTTPWTLPTNFAVAVNAELDYSLVRVNKGDSPLNGKDVILGAGSLKNYVKELGEEPEVIAAFKGKDIAGLKYYPIFDYFPRNYDAPDVNLTNAYQVHTADYVGEGEGTGLVHIAPYGEDDMVVLGELGVQPPVPMTDGARLTAEISDYQDLLVFDANKPIVADLREGTGSQARISAEKRAILVRTQSVAHSYPHCWRCRQPLIYRPISSWFVAVTKLKPRISELNEQINWIPNNVKHGQFGKWLEGARDWAISRNRYWGAPIPVWVSDNPEFPRTDVYGSVAELEADFADCLANDQDAQKAYPSGKITDLHRPKIDTLTRTNPDDPSGKSKMRRIDDVFDCWFESGSMPFASVHYPFENKEWFEEHYPADFIVEYIGQTRGWFYLMHIMATALFDRPSFTNVMCHGIVLGDDGQKMSKSLQNYPNVNEVFNSYGSDAMRWFLMSSNILNGGNLSVTENAIRDTVRNILLPIWSTYYFFTTYANSANSGNSEGNGFEARRISASDYNNLITNDRYILAKTRGLVGEVVRNLEDYDIAGACEAVRDFTDILTNWYVRTNRQRFWDEDANAFNTLWTVLEYLSRAIAPLLPLVSEEIWRGLTGGESVHLQPFPSLDHDKSVAETLQNDVELVATTDKVREIISAALSLRKVADMRVRQPLANLKIAVNAPEKVKAFESVILTELNLKGCELIDAKTAQMSEFGLTQRLDVNARALGPRIGKRVQDVIKAAKAGSWELKDDKVSVTLEDGAFALENGEYELSTVTDANNGVNSGETVAATLASGGFIVLDLALTDELINEGLARDIIREVQDARKQAGLEVSDRIALTIHDNEQRILAARAFSKLVQGETLATSLVLEVSESAKIEVAKE